MLLLACSEYRLLSDAQKAAFHVHEQTARLLSLGLVSLLAARLAYAFISLRSIEVSVSQFAEARYPRVRPRQPWKREFCRASETKSALRLPTSTPIMVTSSARPGSRAAPRYPA